MTLVPITSAQAVTAHANGHGVYYEHEYLSDPDWDTPVRKSPLGFSRIATTKET